MTGVERRAIIFFGLCVLISLALEAIDAGGLHSVVLRLAAAFSFVIGLVVLLVRGHEKTRRQAAPPE